MKKPLIITLIIILILGGFFYFKNKNSSTTGTSSSSSSGFRSFFSFGTKKQTSDQAPLNETVGSFTSDTQTQTAGQTTTATTGSTVFSVFGTSGPFTPVSNSPISGGGVTGSGEIGNGGGISGGGISGGGGITGGGDTGTGGTGGGGAIECSVQDTTIEFTPEEIARLQALEQQFYALAPSLHTDADLQAENANYSSYALLNQKYTELISYCENKTPLLPSDINRRVATPLYTSASANDFFANGSNPDGSINMLDTTPKLREIEKIFRLNIW